MSITSRNYLKSKKITMPITEVYQIIDQMNPNKKIIDKTRNDGILEFDRCTIAFEINGEYGDYQLSINCSNKSLLASTKKSGELFLSNLTKIYKT